MTANLSWIVYIKMMISHMERSIIFGWKCSVLCFLLCLSLRIQSIMKLGVRKLNTWELSGRLAPVVKVLEEL